MKLLEQWLPPGGAGQPVACLATSFTFDADFFAQDCLARFLRLTDTYGEGDEISDVALLLEEEERLSEARVSVLVDRSCNPEARNLRWDVLPVTVRGGLLHAKVTVLVWDHATRFLIGSANLTAAGYRRQIEISTSIDLENAEVPRSLLLDLVGELRSLVTDLVPGDSLVPGPKQRALMTLELVEARIRDARLPERLRGVKLEIGASRPGSRPLDGFAKVWSGPPPRSLMALAPFWDTDDEQLGARELLARLAARSTDATRTSATFVVPVEPGFSGPDLVRAPRALRSVAPKRVQARVCAFAPPADDERRLHAKCVLYESATWLAAMIGSSNVSAKGLGVDPRPHRELNLWIGCRADSRDAGRLRELITVGSEIASDARWEPEPDEDEDPPPALPLGFVDAQLTSSTTLRLRFDASHLPSAWRVLLRAARSVEEATLVDDVTWHAANAPAEMDVKLPPDSALPSGLAVRWQEHAIELGATWLVNVADLAILPPPSELRELPSSVLLSVLASTRPIREALERELRRANARVADGSVNTELDPLKRFDSSGFLLQRIRRASGAFWGLEQRLARPIPSVEALEWRMSGSIGPLTLAQRLVDEARTNSQMVGETQFLLAELAMTVAAIPWARISGRVDRHAVQTRVGETLDMLRQFSIELAAEQPTPGTLHDYIEASFARCVL